MAVAVENRAELSQGLADFIEQWRGKPGNLIMVLHKTQEEYGYVPEPVAREVARRLGVPDAQVFGVLTFYNYFNLEPPGKHRIAVCMGTACYLKGAGSILEDLSEHLNVAVNAVTEDMQFSLQAVRCIGCCGLAPAVLMNDEVVGKLSIEKMRETLEPYKDGDGRAGDAAAS